MKGNPVLNGAVFFVGTTASGFRSQCFWLVVWNMFSFSIQLGIIIPTGLSYFSEGLKPPTSNGFPKQMICKWWRVVATLRDCPVLWRSICQLLAAPMSKYNAWSFDWQNIATFELETYYLRTSKSLLGVH